MIGSGSGFFTDDLIEAEKLLLKNCLFVSLSPMFISDLIERLDELIFGCFSSFGAEMLH
jgi:hypothetical protein